ncbi:MAG: low molecular weight protein arginine phosphatase [Clostridiales bacterium]|nr:low molecular weight protein arginine phosphatase [Clostridiales bacterium]
MQKHKIVFVCTGNTCRSPMAAALFARLVRERGKGEQIAVLSAGLAACDGDAAAQNAVKALEERGIDLTDHRSRKMTRELLEEAEWVVCLSESHRQALLPHTDQPDKLMTLGADIPDPFGGDLETYRVCRDVLEQRCEELYEQLLPD